MRAGWRRGRIFAGVVTGGAGGAFASTHPLFFIMLISTVLIWLLVAVAFVIALPSLWLCGQALWPEKMRRRRLAAELGLWRTFYLGLAPVIGGVMLVSVLSKVPKMGALAVVAGGLLLAWGLLGAGGLAALVGQRLWAGAAPWRQTCRGGLLLMGCALLPVVGWVVVLPVLAVLGWGLHIRAWFVKSPPLPCPAAAPEPSAAAPCATADA